MGHTNIAFLQSPISGDTGNKCDDVLIDPDFGDMPLNVTLSTTQTNGHIFYRITSGSTANPPVHDGDNAISPTVRIGTNSATIRIGSGTQKQLTAICYEAGFTDSNISYGSYDIPVAG